MKLILGLGNPGTHYERTRHNLGFLAVDALAAQEGGAWKTDTKRHAQTCDLTIGTERILLAKPTTFMNLSGDAAAALTAFYKIPPGDMLIVHDEMDLEPGRLQLKPDGAGSAGHNGVASILERLGTKHIARLRIGIGRPEHAQQPTEDFVLGALSTDYPLKPLDIAAKVRDWIEGRVS